MPDFKPADVFLHPHMSPCLGLMEHAEAEHAAAVYIRTCQVIGRWVPVWSHEIYWVAKTDVEKKEGPLHLWWENPFFRPIFNDLVQRGFARYLPVGDEGDLKTNGPVEFTEKGFAAIQKIVVCAECGLLEVHRGPYITTAAPCSKWKAKAA